MNANAVHDGGDGVGSPGFSIVVAMDRNRGIGKDGDLPWPKLKGDMKFFRELTTCPDRAAVEKRWGLKTEESADVQTWEDVSAMLKFAHPLPVGRSRNAVLMGRKTWESLPEVFRPLRHRFNGVLSRAFVDQQHQTLGDRTWPFFENALAYLFFGIETGDTIIETEVLEKMVDEVFVIGGGEVFSYALGDAACSYLYITEIDAEFPCDTFFPETPDFKPALSSPWIEENGFKYRFRRYDRVSA